MSIRRLSRILASLLLGASFATLAQKSSLTVYTALETDQLKAYKEAFEKSNPTVEINWVRDSTGVITARLVAEKANPRADVVMGVAASSLAVLDIEGMLQAYAPAGLARIPAQYRDAKNPPAWVGMDVFGTTVCFNTVEAAKRNLPKPESWKDLTKPAYAGQVVMPHPASSGTGYLAVIGWMTSFGEADAWKFMDGLHANIAQYTHSGSAPCARAAAGEFTVGISFEYRANREKARGRTDRPGVPDGRPRLGPRSDRHSQGHEESGRGTKAARLVDHRRGHGPVREQLCDRRDPDAVQAAAACARRLRVAPGQG